MGNPGRWFQEGGQGSSEEIHRGSPEESSTRECNFLWRRDSEGNQLLFKLFLTVFDELQVEDAPAGHTL
ncbi:hypothetical protein AMECASPLE_036686 [Ameca splendens]|uniref:Uncharacterized protein n=1 Tax=Ameca splendens TaxID=208324 RepID=A0ABV0Z7F3_9TELE